MFSSKMMTHYFFCDLALSLNTTAIIRVMQMQPQFLPLCIHKHLSYAATIICRVHPQSFVIAFYHAHNKIASTLHSVQ